MGCIPETNEKASNYLIKSENNELKPETNEKIQIA